MSQALALADTKADDLTNATPMTITLPATVSFRRARDGETFTVPLGTLTTETLIAALTHGFKQKFNDALNVEPEAPETPATITNALLARMQENGWYSRAPKSGSAGASPFDRWLLAQLTTAARAELKANKLIGVRIGDVVYHKATPDAITAIAQHKFSTLSDKKLAAFRALFDATQATIVDIDDVGESQG
jgi:hypothetical protein